MRCWEDGLVIHMLDLCMWEPEFDPQHHLHRKVGMGMDSRNSHPGQQKQVNSCCSLDNQSIKIAGFHFSLSERDCLKDKGEETVGKQCRLLVATHTLICALVHTHLAG